MRRRSGIRKVFIILIISGAAWLVCGTVSAAITQQCGYCHTMHNSQDNAAFTTTEGAAGTGASTTNGALLRWNCIGCHGAARNTADPLAGTPKVQGDVAPVYSNGDDAAGSANNSLAGGDFFWVIATDGTGHNVVECGDPQEAAPMDEPPGWDTTVAAFSGRGAGDAWPANQLKCAGTYGCHGVATEADPATSLNGAHHGDDGTVDGTTVGKSYRYLNGILGLEDANWEWDRDAADHNQYKGADRAKTTGSDTIAGSGQDTISYLCAQCHGNFHSEDGAGGIIAANAWIRHPVEYDMANTADTTEYSGYPDQSETSPYDNIATAAYSTAVPLASVDVSGVLAAVDLRSGSAANQAIIACVSCHRAHGSPYLDAMRWDYIADCDAGGAVATCGCFSVTPSRMRHKK